MSDNFPAPVLFANRVLVGLRTLSRGADFTAYVNLADEQNDPNIAVRLSTLMTTWADDVTAPSGRAVLYNPPGVTGIVPRIWASLRNDLAPQYYGTYHVFLRCRQSGGNAGEILVQFRLYEGVGSFVPLYVSETKSPAYTNAWQVLDFGRVTVGRYGLRPTDEVGNVILNIALGATSGTPNLYLYDLIVLPVDEWAGDFVDPSNSATLNLRLGFAYDTLRYLDIDSTIPRTMLRGLNRQTSDDRVLVPYTPIAAGPAIFQAGVAQRLWFFNTRFVSYTTNTAERRAEPYIASRVQAFRANRYLSMRGAS